MAYFEGLDHSITVHIQTGPGDQPPRPFLPIVLMIVCLDKPLDRCNLVHEQELIHIREIIIAL